METPLDRPRASSYAGDPLKPGEIAGLLGPLAGRTPLELRDRAMLELAYGSGLRAEEIVNLDVMDLDTEARTLVATAKGVRRRVPGGSPGGWPALAAWLERGRPALAVAEPGCDRPLFISKSGRRLSPSDVRRRLAIATRAADLQDLGDLVGRAKITTTRTGSRVESKRLRKAYANAHPRA